MRHAPSDWETHIRPASTDSGHWQNLPGLLTDSQIDLLALIATLAIFVAYILLRRDTPAQPTQAPERRRLAPPRPMTVPLSIRRTPTRTLTRMP